MAIRKTAKPSRSKILLVLPEFPPKIGGMQTHAYYLSEHLYQRGYTIEVVTYFSDDKNEDQLTQQFDESCPYPVHRVLSRIGFWYNISMVTEIGKRYRPDLIYASTVFYGFLESSLRVPVLARSVGNDILRPWIVYPFRPGSRLVALPWFERNVYGFFRVMEKPEWLDHIFVKKRKKLMTDSLMRLQRVFANSDYTAKLLSDNGFPGERIEVIVGGVDTPRFSSTGRHQRKYRHLLGLPTDRFILITACRLVKKKGIDFLLQCFAKLAVQLPAAHLVIIGDGPLKKKCESLALALQIQDRVQFTGQVPHDRIHEYYWAADLFVLASSVYIDPRLGIRDAETMGRVLCEANAAGLPIIASRSGGIPSVIKHGYNGILFDPGNSDEFINAIITVHKNPAIKRRLISEGKRYARKKFDWPVILDLHETAFASLLFKEK